MEQQHGILLLNKPKGLSSAQCTGRLKRLGQKKIGHGGTLDPMATGLLIVLLGQATKLSGHLLDGGEKTYQGVFRLGQSTDTWDAEGTVVSDTPVHVSEADIAGQVEAWLGITSQPVPPYSAAKHQGQALYKLARAGKDVPEKIKHLKISHAEILDIQWLDKPEVRFRVTCSSGSYIRSLAHSLGMRLGCGATLTELTREYSHPFSLHNAHNLDTVLAEPEALPQRVLPIAAALPAWPVLQLCRTMPDYECAVQSVRNGKNFAHRPEWGTLVPGQALLVDADNKALALVETVETVATVPLLLPEHAVQPSESTEWHILRGMW